MTAGKSEGTNDDTPKEPTPIGDELDPSKQEVEDDEDDAEDEEEDDERDHPFAAKAYKVDVERALARDTQDGKGDEDPGESDFVSYATDEVEVKE